jgi:pimeloyl-ACP methyl ester carboxylesterase
MRIQNGRISLALHERARRPGPSLLLLHALYGSADDWDAMSDGWQGTAFALDFSGHGQSDHLTGGGYGPELLLADADAALQQIGSAAVAGAGLGAYIALLLAGSRADRVPAALLLPGAGLVGGGPAPECDSEFPPFLLNAGKQDPLQPGAPLTNERRLYDPMVQVIDVFARPPDYAEGFARSARKLLLLEDGDVRPPWWLAARKSPSAEAVRGDVGTALQRLQGLL